MQYKKLEYHLGRITTIRRVLKDNLRGPSAIRRPGGYPVDRFERQIVRLRNHEKAARKMIRKMIGIRVVKQKGVKDQDS